MTLPIQPPISPMLAKSVSGIPQSEGLMYEPKWDGFRCIIFWDGEEVVLGSRNEKPLTRYFPELVEHIKDQAPLPFVVDGEIVLISDDQLDFDGLQQRIHPAASRVNMLSQATPASFIAFDLLALNDQDFRTKPFGERREKLVGLFKSMKLPLYLTPLTESSATATEWFSQFEGAGLDGIIAKPANGLYLENKRSMFKIKHERTADCVVAGFRWHKKGDIIGSLLLGLYGDDGVLHHAGITASFTMARRQELVEELAEYRMDSLSDHPWQGWASQSEDDGQRQPGGQSRWNAKKDLSWIPLRPLLVCEVGYDHLQGDRFRHATTFKRWRPDRTPESCTYSQVETITPLEVSKVLGHQT